MISLDHPDPVAAIIRDALALRRIRLDKPLSDCYYYARSQATHECWDALMRAHPFTIQTKGDPNHAHLD